MKIIADAGSTKTTWAFIPADNSSPIIFEEAGINALTSSKSQRRAAFKDVATKACQESESISGVYFYGAGCSTKNICMSLADEIHKMFSCKISQVASDLLGACRALWNEDEGIVCILGTGSNSCIYDGQCIISNVPPMGYILGDEGSGCALGKRLIHDLYRGILPERLKEHFELKTNLNIDKIYEGVYRSDNPRTILSEATRYMGQYVTEFSEYDNLAFEEFVRFLKTNIALYPDFQHYPIGFIGSVALYFEAPLKKACKSMGLHNINILHRPIEGLIRYHITHIL